MESIHAGGMIIRRAVFTISGAVEFLLNHPWQPNFSEGLQTRAEEWKSTSKPREKKEIAEAILRDVSVRRWRKRESLRPEVEPLRRPERAPNFSFQTSLFQIRYLGFWNKCHADILSIPPRCWLLSQNGARKKKRKKKKALYVTVWRSAWGRILVGF